eukprot:gene8615-9494_t
MSSQLLSSIKMGSLELANRVVMAPLTRGRAGIARMPNDYMREYYEMRASAGLIIAEAAAVCPQGYGWYAAPGLYNKEHSDAWKPIVDAVHNKGGKIFIQQWHMGRQSHSTYHETREIVAPSAIKVPDGAVTRDANQNSVPYELPRALTTEEVQNLPKFYQQSAELAKAAGFDGIEIHSANGYLLDTFLQSSTNLRNDQYGGSPENRVRLLNEVIQAVGKVFPYDRIGVRLSPNGTFGGVGSADNDIMFPFVAREISRYGLAYLHVMDGLGFGYHKKCRVVTLYDMKREFGGLVMGNVGFTKETAEGVLRSGAADLIAFGRPYITNPDLVERFKNNWPINPNSVDPGWTGKANPADCLEGYLSYKPYQA